MEISFKPEDLERIRRSVVLLTPRHPAALDREAAIAVLEELQRLQSRDRRVTDLLNRVSTMIEAAQNAGT